MRDLLGELVNGKLRTARKDHECSLCGGKIPTGSSYWDERVGPPDHWENDSWFQIRNHEECFDAWQIIGELLDWYSPGAPYEWLEILEEELRENRKPEETRILEKAIARVNEAGWRTDKSA